MSRNEAPASPNSKGLIAVTFSRSRLISLINSPVLQKDRRRRKRKEMKKKRINKANYIAQRKLQEVTANTTKLSVGNKVTKRR